MIKIAIFLVLVNIGIAFANTSKQLDRINRYTLIQIDTTRFESDGIIELDAYEQHYKVQLEKNDDIHPGKLHHINGNHAEINGHQQFYTNKNESCHFHGKVVNDLKSAQNFVALSLCENRGIRGMIVAFDDTLYIKPATTYLDLSHDKNGHGHNLNDQHLVYLSSDEDYSGLPLDSHIRVSEDEKKFNDVILQQKQSQEPNRRRMANNLRNTVEMLVVMDPAWRQTCENKYTSTTWYDNCINDMADLYNGISAEYVNQNWGSNSNGQIGTIAVAFAQVHVMFGFSGDDAELYPDFIYSNCKDMMNEDCEIDGSGYLGKLKTWFGNKINKGESNGGYESSNIDDVQLWSTMNFKDAGGWGYIGTVCRGSYATANIAAIYGDAWSIRSAAHELGHNFDMQHDQDTSCNINDGLMGYGNANHGFSSCSVSALQGYFREQGGLTCLGSSNFGWSTNNLPEPGDVRSNYGSGNNGNAGSQTDPPTTKPPTDRPTPRPTQQPTVPGQTTTLRPTPTPTTSKPTTKRPTVDGNSDDWQCTVSSFPILETSTFSGNTIRDDKLQGLWVSEGTLNGKVYYQLNGYYLYKKSSYWLIGRTPDDWSVVAYCSADLLSDCDGVWHFYQSGWNKDSSSSMSQSDCGSGGGGDGGSGTTRPPQQCNYHSCLQMNQFGDYSGKWNFHDCDANGKGMYADTNKNNFMCFNTQYNLWFIKTTNPSNGVGCDYGSDTKAYCYWTNAEITQCGANSWRLLQSNSWVTQADALIFDCGSSAFNAEETTECTDSSLNDKICVRGNSNLFTSDGLEFSLFNGQCANSKPIYVYTATSTNTSIITVDGVGLEAETERVYYLHYNLYKKFSNDEEFSGQWVISDGEVNSNYDAVCEQETLTDCLEGEWQILDVTDEAGGKYGGGIIQFIDDIVMTINNADCDGNTNFATEGDDGSGDNAVIIIVVCIVVLLLVAGCAFFLWRRSNKGDDAMIKSHVANNNTRKPTNDEQPDQGSPVPETEVSMERQTDGAQEIVVTTTYE